MVEALPFCRALLYACPDLQGPPAHCVICQRCCNTSSMICCQCDQASTIDPSWIRVWSEPLCLHILQKLSNICVVTHLLVRPELVGVIFNVGQDGTNDHQRNECDTICMQLGHVAFCAILPPSSLLYVLAFWATHMCLLQLLWWDTMLYMWWKLKLQCLSDELEHHCQPYPACPWRWTWSIKGVAAEPASLVSWVCLCKCWVGSYSQGQPERESHWTRTRTSNLFLKGSARTPAACWYPCQTNTLDNQVLVHKLRSHCFVQCGS